MDQGLEAILAGIRASAQPESGGVQGILVNSSCGLGRRLTNVGVVEDGEKQYES